MGMFLTVGLYDSGSSENGTVPDGGPVRYSGNFCRIVGLTVGLLLAA
jgi:hypothetical protein